MTDSASALYGIAPTHVRCGECERYTEIEPGMTAEETACFHCQESGLDASCVVAVAVVACPDGVTASDWSANARHCADVHHEPRTGNHIIEVG